MGIWLGLTDENNEGFFQWSNGDSLTFTNWLPNQTDNFTNSGNPNGQDYVLMEPSTGKWDDDNGEFSLQHFVLEISSILTNVSGCDSTAVLNLTIK